MSFLSGGADGVKDLLFLALLTFISLPFRPRRRWRWRGRRRGAASGASAHDRAIRLTSRDKRV